jgi:deazaflavin-dependent oxidoreductase (nitroreductase family)
MRRMLEERNLGGVAPMRNHASRLAAGVLSVVAAGLVLSGGLFVILRYQPRRALAAARKLFGRVLNPIFLRASERLGIDQSVVYHVGRRSGREYVTPLCVVETPEGFIIPAAFGSEVDWLRNLRATPRARLHHEGVDWEVEAEVIGRDDAYRLAGGTAGCPCWDQFRIEAYAVLRPTSVGSGRPSR